MPRPEHPDFWEIAAAVQDLDSAVDDGTPIERVVSVDFESLMYVAMQRALRLGIQSPAVAAMWLDGFAAGALYGRREATTK